MQTNNRKIFTGGKYKKKKTAKGKLNRNNIYEIFKSFVFQEYKSKIMYFVVDMNTLSTNVIASGTFYICKYTLSKKAQWKLIE